MHSDCAIIGGGLAGLTAAHTLHRQGNDVLVYESALHIGGRIQSIRNALGKPIADLGPTWVWPPYQPSIAELIDTLGLALFSQFNTGDAIMDWTLGMTPKRQFLPGQQGMSRITDGPQAIIDALAADIPDTRVKLGHHLRSIEHKDSRFHLHFDDISVTANKVIIAAPLRLIAEQVAWNGLVGTDILNAMENAPTWMATQAKATILYKTAFWRDNGLSGRIASQVGPLAEAHDHSSADGKHPALFGFVGLPPEMRDQTLPHQIIDQLERCFGQVARQFLDITIKDWAQDKNICSQMDLNSASSHPEVLSNNMRQGFVGGTLHFAVAETAIHSPGLIDGAVESGTRAAKAVLAI